jgi:hypothetical protein
MSACVRKSYQVGSTVRVTARFWDDAGVPADPTTVTFFVRSTTGVVDASFTYPGPAITRVATGHYVLRYKIVDDDPGTWFVRAEGDGVVDEAAERTFIVKPTVFYP